MIVSLTLTSICLH